MTPPFPDIPPPPTEKHALLAWAREQYDRIQEANVVRGYNRSATNYKPHENSALLARLLSGKMPLPHPPPTTFKQPWYDVLEKPGPFEVVFSGTIPSINVPHGLGTIFLEYLSLNNCPWGVVSGNAAAATMSDMLAALRDSQSREEGRQIVASIHESLLQRPEWIVKFEPWHEFRLYLGRIRRRGKRCDIEDVPFFRATLDGTNLEITRVLIDGAEQIEGRRKRLAHLVDRPQHLLQPYELRALRELDAAYPLSDLDWVEYECDGWLLEPMSLPGRRLPDGEGKSVERSLPHGWSGYVEGERAQNDASITPD